MIDPRLLRTDPDGLKRSQEARGESPELIDQLIEADEDRRAAIATFENLRAEQKQLGREVAQATDQTRPELLAKARSLAEEVKQAEAGSGVAEARFTELMMLLPNPVFPDVPRGGEDDFVVVETHGTPRDFAAEGFTPRDHLELGELIGGIDMERGTKISGSRFYVLRGPGALLELALTQYAVSKAVQWGLTPMLVPALVKPEAMEGTGFLGQAAQDVYYLPADDQYLVGTSEVALAAYHMNEILDADHLPLRYMGYSPCFRREAGSYGKDTRGIFRVHWFDKVEMFTYCRVEDSVAEHQRLLGHEKDFIASLGIPFQVLDVAAGDLGLSAARKYDCYGWVPSQQKYREITSTSNCTQFQSRRLNIRARGADGVGPVATLNGTLCAMPRMIIMILENNQQPDGSVIVPEVLRPYMGGVERLEPLEAAQA
ncbi:MAG: serine--tRNA ligase [Propionibacteriaceae bacterium]|jgi:seryl-tRNA synthetase|nr:serine--tRNA ligase [Propionibacteriaceae bacterium]